MHFVSGCFDVNLNKRCDFFINDQNIKIFNENNLLEKDRNYKKYIVYNNISELQKKSK